MNSFDDDRGCEIVAGYVVLFMFTTPLVLTLVFVVLKLLEVITWSWFWVFSPITIPSLIVLFVLVITSARSVFSTDTDIH